MVAVATDIRRPALIYLGGKWKLAPWLLPMFPEHHSYVEPFGGGASVLLRKPRCNVEVYNDLNGDLVHLFRTLRHHTLGPQLVEAVRLTPFSREEFIDAYQPDTDPVERARRLIVRSFMGHGSNSCVSPHLNGFRSKQGERVTPARSWAAYPENLALICQRLQGVTLEHRDAFKVIEYYDAPDTLFYVDPPYVESTRSYKLTRAKTYYPHELTDVQHAELGDLLNRVRGMVVVSGYRCELYDRLFAGWTRKTRRHLAHGSIPTRECVWLNPAATARRRKK